MEESIALSAGFSLLAAKKEQQAIEQFSKVLTVSPNNISAYLGLGVALLQLKKFKAAVSSFKRVLKLQPENIDALFNLAGALSALEYYDHAQAYFEKVLELEPQNSEACYQLGLLMVKSNQDSLSESWLSKAIVLNPRHYKAIASLGVRAQQHNRLTQAVDLFKQSIAIKPDYPQAIVYLGSAYEDLGDKQSAIERYQAALNIDNSNPLALSRWLALDSDSFPLEYLQNIRRLAKNNSLSKEDRVRMLFALGKHFDRKKNFEDAANYFIKANALQNSIRAQYEPEEQARFVERMIATFNDSSRNGKFIAEPMKHSQKKALKASTLSQNVQPIFIVGMPRSGTTLCEQILAAHPLISAAGEQTFFTSYANKQRENQPYPEYLTQLDIEQKQDIAQQYLEYVSTFVDDTPFITDKMPLNFLHIGFILTIFPRAKIVHCTRNPVDIAWSCFKENFNTKTTFANSLSSLKHYISMHNKIMAHWKEVFSSSIITLNYESLLERPKPHIADILAHCELEWHDDCMSFHKVERSVNTPSRWQVRQPLYNSSVKKWEKYRPFVDELFLFDEFDS